MTPTTDDDYRRYYDQSQGQIALMKAKREGGWLSIIFGDAKSAPLNIAGLTVVLLVGGWVALVFTLDAGQRAENVKLLLPVLTAVIGYVFGKKT